MLTNLVRVELREHTVKARSLTSLPFGGQRLRSYGGDRDGRPQRPHQTR